VNPGTYARFSTSEGDFVVRLFAEQAPNTVANFVGLAEGTKEWTDPRTSEKVKKPYYDGVIFHRVIKGFMIQGGDPLTKDLSAQSRWGTGGPGHQVKAEFNKKPHTRGVLSMARSQDPDSAGSQFFICHGDPRFLDGQYTAFGKLIEGDDVLEKIATTKTAPGDRPLERQEIQSVTIKARDEK
jgi:cyclophilin family peptidyl-prolyl cis-trans isomerase